MRRYRLLRLHGGFRASVLAYLSSTAAGAKDIVAANAESAVVVRRSRFSVFQCARGGAGRTGRDVGGFERDVLLWCWWLL